MAHKVRVTVEGMAHGDLEQLSRMLVNAVGKMSMSPSAFGAGFVEPKLVSVEFVDAPESAGEDMSDMDRDELAALAEARGIEVVREDGRTDLKPRVSDYLAALS